VRIAVLGPVQAVLDGADLDLGPRKQRALLSGLVMHAGRVVPVETLVDLLWGDSPPAAVQASLHGYVAALRRILEPGRAARSGASVLVTRGAGYLLDVGPEAVDAAVFARQCTDAHRRLGGDALAVAPGCGRADLDAIDEQLAAALALWRGEPYPELPAAADADAERARLAELRWTAEVDRGRIGLALGRPAEVAAALTPLTHEQPLREDVWAVLALALARAGRQADSLRALATARRALADELGIDAGPVLAGLELAVLRQDPAVAGAAAGPLPTEPVAATALPSAAQAARAQADDGPFVGRAGELDALRRLLDRARQGQAQLALLVGEPGIGKSRLTRRLADLAAEAGFAVLTGRCSSDEGAPPLWPWSSVLRGLADAVPDIGVPDLDPLLDHPAGTPPGVDRFRLFDAVVSAVTAAAGRRPLLLVLDDLHWADASTLRLLQHLVEHASGPLAVVGTRRAHPEPEGPLRELGEALARRDALRIELQGLTVDEVAALAAATGAVTAGAHAVRDRTGGNPFFVVELLRLAAAGGVPADAPVPASVGDVVTARVGQLPEATRSLLAAAAALGRSVDVDLLARLQQVPADDVLDGLEPALASGLVVVDSDGTPRFAHALVRDAVEAAVSPLRRQRRHAELARLLEDGAPSGARPTEIAGHWLRAGPAHAARAWRTAATAAAYASGLSAHEEATDLLRGAAASQRLDPAAGPDERYEVLLALACACRAAGDGRGQANAAGQAVALAEEAGDVQRLAEAAVAASEGALWSNRPEGEVHAPTLRALRQALDRLPSGDSALRCSVLLALARELFWAPGRREAQASAEQALAMARRLDDDHLLAAAGPTMMLNDYRPATLGRRLELADESVAAARRVEDPEVEGVAVFMAALMYAEAGRVDDHERAVTEALRLAGTRRLRYLQVMTGAHHVPWLALQGRFEEASRLLADVGRWAAYTAFPFRDEAVLAAQACLELWRGGAGRLVDAALSLDARSPTDMGTFLLLLLLRAGRPEQARTLLDVRPVPIADDYFAASMDLAIGAEAALVLHRPDLAADVYPLLAQWPGRPAMAGTGSPLGPVDAFLALAAAAVGERDLATRHADEALRLCAAWRMGPVAEWFAGLRAGYGF
jgi:DNA-binding SARP family transcriptional activator/DNA replicative helicase MCM subunit Mcm2 (Cdc46/Mcm family)